jgi:hypothetical protein
VPHRLAAHDRLSGGSVQHSFSGGVASRRPRGANPHVEWDIDDLWPGGDGFHHLMAKVHDCPKQHFDRDRCASAGMVRPVLRSFQSTEPLAPRFRLCESSREAMRRKLVALFCVTALTAAACSNARHDAAPTTTKPPSTVASAPNPDVIPPVITPAYVDAVFVVLNHINGNVSRQLIKDHRISAGSLSELRAIFGNPLFQTEIDLAKQSLTGSTANVRNPPGDLRTTVSHLLTASDRCIFAETSSDFVNVLLRPGPPAASEYYRLSPQQSGGDPTHINPTPWIITFNAAYRTSTSIPNQCI